MADRTHNMYIHDLPHLLRGSALAGERRELPGRSRVRAAGDDLIRVRVGIGRVGRLGDPRARGGDTRVAPPRTGAPRTRDAGYGRALSMGSGSGQFARVNPFRAATR